MRAIHGRDFLSLDLLGEGEPPPEPCASDDCDLLQSNGVGALCDGCMCVPLATRTKNTCVSCLRETSGANYCTRCYGADNRDLFAQEHGYSPGTVA